MNRKLVALLTLSAVVLASPQSLGAANLSLRIIVGDGTPESCTEFALQDALTTARSTGGDDQIPVRGGSGHDPTHYPKFVGNRLPGDTQHP